MAVKVSTNKLIDLLFGLRVQILKLMDGGELLDVQSVGENSIRFPLQKMLALKRSNVGDGSEYIC
jgi:hypothetical protein